MRIIIIAAALVAGWYGYRWFVRQSTAVRWRAFGVAALLALLLLAATGRLHWLVALAAAALPVLRRLPGLLLTVLPALQRYRRHQRQQAGGQPSGGQRSVVQSRFLRMTLEHDSGDMDGRVLSGRFEGHTLSAMSLPQLRELLAECQREDEESSALLLAWLQRVHGEEWQQHEQPPGPAGGSLTRGEALAILGLEEGADAGQIRDAHRRLMQKLHPDRGGSPYLAARVNQAREKLLEDA